MVSMEARNREHKSYKKVLMYLWYFLWKKIKGQLGWIPCITGLVFASIAGFLNLGFLDFGAESFFVMAGGGGASYAM